MKCKNCGYAADDQHTYCPNCGEPLEQNVADGEYDAACLHEQASAQCDVPGDEQDAFAVGEPGDEAGESPYEEHPDELSPDDGLTEEERLGERLAEGEDIPPAPQKRSLTGAIAIILALGVLMGLAAMLIFALRGDQTPSEEPGQIIAGTQDGDDFVDPAPAPVADAVVATSSGHELTNEQFLFYYWDEFYYLYNQYGDYITYLLDPSQSLAAQEQSEGVSWREYFTASAMNTWAQTMALCDLAASEGYTLDSEAQTALDTVAEQLDTFAAQYGETDGLSYLRASYDEVCTLEGYLAYLHDSYLATGFINQKYSGMLEDHADLADDLRYGANVRHILIETSEEFDAEAAKAEAERIYALWQEDPTEDNFATLANEHSTDPGSNENGGLYENVTPGQMVANFNDWCFAEGRATGDHGLVETDYGWHILYYCGLSDTPYESGQETAALGDYDVWIEQVLSPVTYDRSPDDIGFSR